MPGWMKAFGAAALVVVAIIAGLHLTGNWHPAHGDTDIHVMPAGHGLHPQ
jgi:hypothetical protein